MQHSCKNVLFNFKRTFLVSYECSEALLGKKGKFVTTTIFKESKLLEKVYKFLRKRLGSTIAPKLNLFFYFKRT